MDALRYLNKREWRVPSRKRPVHTACDKHPTLGEATALRERQLRFLSSSGSPLVESSRIERAHHSIALVTRSAPSS